MNLETSALSILEQFPSHPGGLDVRKPQDLVERFGNVAVGGLGLAIAAGISGMIYLIITRMILSGSQVWAGALLAGFLVFAGLSLLYVFLRESQKERLAKVNPHLRESLRPRLQQTLLEEGNVIPPASVTDSTTQLLHAEGRTQKF